MTVHRVKLVSETSHLHFLQAYVTVDGVPLDILIDGLPAQNRAVFFCPTSTLFEYLMFELIVVLSRYIGSCVIVTFILEQRILDSDVD